MRIDRVRAADVSRRPYLTEDHWNSADRVLHSGAMDQTLFSVTTFESDTLGVLGVMWQVESSPPQFSCMNSLYGEDALSTEEELWCDAWKAIDAAAEKHGLGTILLALLNYPDELIDSNEFQIGHYEFCSEADGGQWQLEDSSLIESIEKDPNVVLLSAVRVDLCDADLPQSLTEAAELLGSVYESEMDCAIEENGLHFVLLN